MKILICYHSITGNTEQVAKCIADGLAGEEITLMHAKDVDPSSLPGFDVIFLGSGVYAAAVGKHVKNLMKNAENLPSKFVLFYTHATNDPHKCFYRVEKQITSKGASIIAKFDCYGDTRPKDEVIEAFTPEQKENYFKKLQGHPNAKDLEDAKNFAKAVLKKL
jgi:flavodoxin